MNKQKGEKQVQKTDQKRKIYETPGLVKLANLRNVTASWQCSLGGGDDDDYGHRHHHHGGDD